MPYLACTPCVPLFCTLFKRGGNRRALDYQGRAGIIFIVRWDLRPVIFSVEKIPQNSCKISLPKIKKNSPTSFCRRAGRTIGRGEKAPTFLFAAATLHSDQARGRVVPADSVAPTGSDMLTKINCYL